MFLLIKQLKIHYLQKLMFDYYRLVRKNPYLNEKLKAQEEDLYNKFIKFDYY